MTARRLPALALAGLLAGCVGGASIEPSPTPTALTTPEPTHLPPTMTAPSESPQPGPDGTNPAPRWLTPANDGATFTMAVGQPVSLVIGDPTAPDPELDGHSVELIEIVNVQASGQREWEVVALVPGRTVIRGGGSPAWTITLEVAAP